MQVGDIVIAKITNIIGYGAFVTVGDYDGLVHISEFSDNFVKNIGDFVKVGDEIRLRVLEVDNDHLPQTFPQIVFSHLLSPCISFS